MRIGGESMGKVEKLKMDFKNIAKTADKNIEDFKKEKIKRDVIGSKK